jgi:Sulfotransferase family
MISHPHKTLFVHIPKCGGQSIEDMFLSDLGLGRKDKSQLLLRKPLAGERGPPRLGHLTASDYTGLGFIERELFDSYYRFSVVRNPFDRLRSAYNYLGFRDLVGFAYFVDEIAVKSVECRDSWHWFLRPQTDFLLDADGTLLVHEYFRLESLSASIDAVIERTRLSIRELPHSNHTGSIGRTSRFVRAMKLMLRDRIRLRTVMMKMEPGCDSKTRARIELLYSADFERFGY